MQRGSVLLRAGCSALSLHCVDDANEDQKVGCHNCQTSARKFGEKCIPIVSSVYREDILELCRELQEEQAITRGMVGI